MPDEVPTGAIELGLWDERMFDVVRQRDAAYQSYLFMVDMARESLNGALAKLGEQRESLASMRDDRVVLVRNTQGPEVTTYHSADGPCGRVIGKSRRLSSFDRKLEGEVRSRLSRCGACHWPPPVPVLG